MTQFVKSTFDGQWRGGFDGSGSIKAGGVSTSICLPTEFKGTGIGTTPEDLVVSALGSCYLITLGIIFEKNNIGYESLQLSADLLTDPAFPPKIKEIILKPRVLSSGDASQILAAMHKAEAMCLVSQAVQGNITKTIQPEIIAV